MATAREICRKCTPRAPARGLHRATGSAQPLFHPASLWTNATLTGKPPPRPVCQARTAHAWDWSERDPDRARTGVGVGIARWRERPGEAQQPLRPGYGRGKGRREKVRIRGSSASRLSRTGHARDLDEKTPGLGSAETKLKKRAVVSHNLQNIVSEIRRKREPSVAGVNNFDVQHFDTIRIAYMLSSMEQVSEQADITLSPVAVWKRGAELEARRQYENMNSLIFRQSQ
ncbi:hypothetical protein C8R47DRAFT_1065461 [Mycena vitilis]|nr:hypothetical protein C8R47DRAFT_1065461 [Mycena vitilis]